MQLSGQITVLQTSTKGPDVSGNMFLLKPHPSNTVTVWVGNVDNVVTSGNGYPIAYDASPIIVQITNLESLYFLSGSTGQKICWLILE